MTLLQKFFPASSEIITLVRLLRWRADRQPDQLACTFLVDGESQEACATYMELDQRARCIGAALQNTGAMGDRVLLLYPPGLDYIAAFFGCLYAGRIAVPCYPPKLNRPDPRLAAILADSGATVALTTQSILSDVEKRADIVPGLSLLRWIAADQLDESLFNGWNDPAISGEQIAFLQYTSGSTRTPRGVMVTHANLLCNLDHARQLFSLSEHDCMVSWTPPYHDMGLIGGILQPVYTGFPLVLMAPVDFLQNPFRWLNAISRYRGTISGGPNFAYDFCAQRISAEQRARLDLSSWSVAFNAAEPVQAHSLEHFAHTFVDCGFRSEAFLPCYGLAEATLIVSGKVGARQPFVTNIFNAESLGQGQAILADADEPSARRLVSCGELAPGLKAKIVDPQTCQPCPDGRIGEVWVSGPSVAQGYWQRNEETQTVFCAYTDAGEGPFMRTGDLGFWHGQELYIAGRAKDLIIIGGRNYYPQDIEFTVGECHPALRDGRGAAFSVDVDGEERLVVVYETDRHAKKPQAEEIIGAIRRAISEEHQLQVYGVALLKYGHILKTTSGKVQHYACRAGFLDNTLNALVTWRLALQPEETAMLASPPAKMEALAQKDAPSTIQEFRTWLAGQIAQRARISAQNVDFHQPFANYGLDSKGAVMISGELEKLLGRRLSPALVYEYPTVDALAHYLTSLSLQTAALAADAGQPGYSQEAIAIIGLSCRFPGAPNPEAFWKLLESGGDAIREVPPERWNLAEFYDPIPKTPGRMYTRFGGFIEKVDEFDPGFFNISPAEAARMDPQQRLLLEVSWEALENAAQTGQIGGSSTGVFIGISSSDYAHFQFGSPEQMDAYAGTGNAHSIAANRLSYLLDLRGPSMAVDTACSSSLVAVHLACQSLRHKECRLALAGGVNLILTPHLNISFSQAGLMSPDGRCKTFAAEANGYVRSEGCGIVVLKRLVDAQADGDLILAVVRGSAVNQDGRTNGLTAPNGLAQQAVIRQALADAGVSPNAVSYVEAHGTGTVLGDPIEVESLTTVLGEKRPAEQKCLLGSAKANIGHLESAAGVAGLIKTVLCLQNRVIPRQIHLQNVNPYLRIEETPFVLPKEAQRWVPIDEKYIAGISSFGFGGTNAHLIVENAPTVQPTPAGPAWPAQLVTISAKSKNSLQMLAQRYVEFCALHPGDALSQIALTANTGRAHWLYRAAIVADSTYHLGEQLANFVSGQDTQAIIVGDATRGELPKLAFLFTGGGAQYPGMGEQLYQTQPVFRQTLDECAALLTPYLGIPLLSIIYPTESDSADRVHDIAYMQPALFAVDYALAQLWRSWGIEPAAVLGHSLGEYVAACVAGAFSLEDGLKLVAARGRLMQELPRTGQMAVIFADAERVADVLKPYAHQVSIAAINGPAQTVISGEQDGVQSVLEKFRADKISIQVLKISQASHSPLIAPALDAFEQIAAQVEYRPLQIPLVSNATGELLPSGTVLNAAYWRRHFRETVQFMAGIRSLASQGYGFFIESGPTPTLIGLGKRCLPKGSAVWIQSLHENETGWKSMLGALGALYAHGFPVDWKHFHRDFLDLPRLSLPVYPFDRKAYWVKIPVLTNQSIASSSHLQYTLSAPQGENDMENITSGSSSIKNTGQRKLAILEKLCGIVAPMLEVEPNEVDLHAPFLEMGADSIILVSAVRVIEENFGLTVTIEQLFTDYNTLDKLATYIDAALPPDVHVSASASQSVAPASPAPVSAPASIALPAAPIVQQPVVSFDSLAGEMPTSEIGRIMSQQLQILSQQLVVLGGQRPGVIDVKSAHPVATAVPETQPVRPALEQPKPATPITNAKKDDEHAQPAIKPYVPFHQIQGPSSAPGIPDQQKAYTDSFAERYIQRSKTSRQLTEKYRPVLADSRASVGFRFSTKEMIYPIVLKRSSGARIWDVDDNEYVDVTMGFGVHLFGHNPAFITEAIQEQVKNGIELGPRSPLVGEVAQMISEMTGHERVAFLNSGTEAVMISLRLARAATQRTKIALFNGAYHGQSDGTLVHALNAVDGDGTAIPMAPGVSARIAEDILIVDYDTPRSLEILRAHAHELAAVLVEPVQSRRPDIQPREFLHELRAITQASGTALIFDEMVCGFRMHPGGAQAHFGVKADLATYGKIIGGGLPIGVIAGKAQYLDGVDGGQWNYGDFTYPNKDRTFVGGTFSQHPLTMAAAHAVLCYLKEQGPELQAKLNERTKRMADTLNDYFEQNEFPIQVLYCGSNFRFLSASNLELLFYHMLAKGVYIWEWRACYLSTAHTDEDIDHIIRATKESVEEMRAGGFLPRPKA